MMPARDPGPARGILWQAPMPGDMRHLRRGPPQVLAGLVQHAWIVRWDLRGHAPQLQETLPHPNVHLIYERGTARVFGLHTARYTRRLEGAGFAFGVKFRAGGFRPWLGRAVASISNRDLSPAEVFADAAVLERALDAAAEDDDALIEAAWRFLGAHLPAPDAQVERVAAIVDEVAADVAITRVEQLAERHASSPRALQRLFREYVGASPKWVIARYRLHEAIEQIARGEANDWSALALDLGYFDQAHFIRDFKRLVGHAPADYARRARASLA